MIERALVLAGAGSAGNAWEIGVIAGLFEAGLDVTQSDLTIGTSAGSTAAAQITSGTQPAELLAAILAAETPPRTALAGSDGGRARIVEAANMMEKTSAIIAAAENPADMRRRMGAAALETDPVAHSSAQKKWRATVAARLPSQHWPQRPMLIVAVDADTGEPVVFDRHNGVDLVDAVAASTSNGSPYSIGDRRYINGGYRRNENAVRRQCDGSVAASARCSSRLQPGQSPCRAAHPSSGADTYEIVDSVGVTTPTHASDGRWARRA